jgi:hypothetical protein
MLVAQTGCSVWQQARRTLISEPAAFSWKWDRSRSLKAYRRWADEAWMAERGGCPDVAGDADYALGFRDGFVDYIYAGGDGEPPPVPPRQYWNVALRGPDGKAAASQWFAGYRHGANVARSSGYRENGVVASSYAWGGAVAWDQAPDAKLIEDLGPADELLPEPAEAGVSDDSTEHEPALPEFTLPETPPVDAEPPIVPEREADDSSEAAPSAPIEPRGVDGLEDDAIEDVAPAAPPESALELDPPTAGVKTKPRVQSARAVERFRRAVSTVQFVEPRATK